MRNRSPASLFGLALFTVNRCPSCALQALGPRQFLRQISQSHQRLQTPPSAQPPEKRSRADELKPVALRHPLGLPYPPKEGQNTGVDPRTFRQRRQDLVDQEKHLQRRDQLVKEFSKPYFRDWLRTRYHHGKTFISNPRLIKGDRALYFPNLYGRTLRKRDPLEHTTTVLQGKISVVSIFSTLWAERQAATFVGVEQNPGLHELINGSPSIAQRVEINVESNWLKALLVRLFMGSTRRKYPTEQHGRYFLVTKGFSETLKEQIGMMNGMVGYVYLVDEACKIRWAGCGLATPGELTSLNNGIRRLIEQRKLSPTSQTPASIAEHSEHNYDHEAGRRKEKVMT